MTSIAYQERALRVDLHVEAAFRAACHEAFEDGTESEFSRHLASLVKGHGDWALDAVRRLITSRPIDVEVVSEALRALGEMQDGRTYRRRLRLLLQCLHSPSLWIRDGATIGLAWMDDPTTIPSLRQAAEREQVEEIRRNIEAIIAQLEATRLCRIF